MNVRVYNLSAFNSAPGNVVDINPNDRFDVTAGNFYKVSTVFDISTPQSSGKAPGLYYVLRGNVTTPEMLTSPLEGNLGSGVHAHEGAWRKGATLGVAVAPVSGQCLLTLEFPDLDLSDLTTITNMVVVVEEFAPPAQISGSATDLTA